jgi:hypothetical protein
LAEDKKKVQSGQQHKPYDNSKSTRSANESIKKNSIQETHVTSRQPGTEGTIKKK